MIVFEDGIESLVNLIEPIDGFAPNFYTAKDSKDINAYLALKDQPYPVIFLQTGDEEGEVKEDDLYNEIERNARFVLAVRETDTSLLNNQRWDKSYKNFLNPLAERLLKQLMFSNITTIEGKYKLERVPNYSQRDENAQIDIWDAIEIECKVIMNNKCL